MSDTPQAKSFRNMNELTAYLSNMEIRLTNLESENKALKNALGQVKHTAAAPTFKTERGLPNTGLVSDSFLLRAFTVWGGLIWLFRAMPGSHSGWMKSRLMACWRSRRQTGRPFRSH